MNYLIPVSTLIILMTSCTNDTVIEKKQNIAPSVLIMSHSEGAEVQDGYTEYFRATVSDDDHAPTELQAVWYVGEEQVCDWAVANPAGESLCEIVFEEGDNSVIVEVRDPQGAGGRAEIGVSVLPTEVPVAEILSPVDGGSYYADQLVQFSALVSDLEDDLDDLVVVWSSSVDGELPLDTTVDSNGELSDYTYLTEGNHAIELRVEDTSGKFSTSEVVIQVGAQNNIPTCQIVEPLDGDSFIVGDTITFRGTAEDLDIPSNELSVEWMSDKDGVFGSSIPTSSGNITFASADLSANTHTISMNVSDEVGALCTEQILLQVGNPPVVSINEPVDGTLVALGDSVLFRATVSDSEDQPGQLQTIWTSDLDGEIENGVANSQGISQFSMTTLSSGTHSITLSVTDTTGLVTDDLVTLQVNIPPEVISIVLSPDPLYSNQGLTAVPAYFDAEGQNVVGTFAWYADGVLQPLLLGSTVPAVELDVGEVWTVRVTPNDGLMDGAFIEETIVVQNSTPVVSSVSVSPSSGLYNDTVLTCTAVASDVDQLVSPTYTWTVNGVTYSGSTLDLSTTTAVPGDVALCTASVTDTQGATDSGSTTVSIDNRAPSMTSVTITPNVNVTTQTSVSCAGVASDLDGEVPSIDYVWEVSGQTIGTGATLDLQNVSIVPNDVLECVATATDASGASDVMSSSVTIDNTQPIIDSLTISPVSPSGSETITCAASASDVDGGTPTLSFVFQELGTGVLFTSTSTTNSSATLDLSALTVNTGSEIECVVTATDVHGGSVTDSTFVTLANSVPTLSAVTISPSGSVYTGDSLTCAVTATDLDDGVLTPTYSWFVNGTVVSSTNTYTVSANDSNVGDTVECVASATDSDNQTVSDSATVLVQNTAPTLSSAPTVSVNQVEIGQIVTCTGGGSDVDGQQTTLTYLWKDLANASTIASGNQFSVANVVVGSQFYCELSISDGLASTTLQSTNIDVLNSPPTISSAFITPNNNLTTSSLLTCTATATDANDGSLTVDYSWTATNGATNTGATWQLSSNIVSTTDNIECIASATDNDGATVTSNPYVVTLNNSAPTVSNVSIIPNSGVTTGTTLSCVANGSDPDDGVLTPTYDWSVNGASISSAATYTVSSSDTNVGDVIVCTATVQDSDGQTASNSASVTLQNSAPYLNGQPILSDSQVEIGDSVTCSVSGSDVDGDTVSLSYQWLDSSDNVLGSSSVYVVSNLSVGEQIRCGVSITDGTTSGTSMESLTATVVNSTPTMTTATITPNTGVTVYSLLTCAATASDANDGALPVTYTWTATSGATNIGASWQLDSSVVSPGDSVGCVASAVDSDAAPVSSTSSPVVVDNTAPSVSNVSISPSSGVYTGTVLTCSATASDVDDGTLTPTYSWSVGGVVIGTGATYTISANDTNVGQQVVCTATATDSDGGTDSGIDSVSVSNTNPTISSVSISPNANVTNDLTLTCSASASDIDESVSPTFAWVLNGSQVATGSSIDLTTHTVSPTDAVACEATVTDSSGGTVSGNAVVSITNRNPVVTQPVLSDSSPEAFETITCSSSASDADGESVSVSYVWTVSGSVVGNSDTLVLSPTTYSVGDVVICEVSASDGYGGTDSASVFATVANTHPTITNANISPSSSLTTSSLLTCGASATDTNDGALSVSYAWTASNGATSSGSTWQLTSNLVSPSDTITCTASATDQNGASVSSTSSSVSLGNSTPTVSNVSVSPSGSVATGTTLTCSASASDPDDGTLTPAYSWSVNGVTVGNAATYTVSSTDTNVGDSVTCTATATDSDNQTAIGTDSVTVINSAPTVSSGPMVSVSQAELYDVVTCSASGTDIDGDSVSLTYEWIDSNGTSLGNGSSYTVNGLQVGETFSCRVVASDGTASSSLQTSSMITVMNTVPTITTASISPSSGITTSSLLTCSATATDVNDGALSVSYAWTASNGATNTGSTWQLNSSTFSPSDSITCVASTTDQNGGTAVSPAVTVTLNNSAPTVSNVSISPSTGVVTGTTLTCSASASDPDDGALTPAYSWSVNGSTVGSNSTYTVSPSATNVGDSILCTATATDSDGQSASGNATVTVINSAPSISSGPTLSASQVQIGDVVTCSASASDVDGDSVSLSYLWSDSSGNTLGTSSSYTVSNLSVGETISCTVTPSDGTASGSSSTSSSATVINTVPTINTPSISPNSITTSTLLTCSTTASDANDGALSVSYSWTASSGATSSGSTWQLTSNLVSPGDTILCSASATDSNGASVSSTSSSATVGNSSPSVSNVRISPGFAVTTGTLLTCSSTAYDQDDGTLTSSYEWSVNGAVVGNNSTYTVSSSDTNVGDTVVCTASTMDSSGQVASGAASIVVNNTAPTLSNLNITSNGQYTNDAVWTCSVNVTDPDESLTPSYQWALNGTGIASGASIDLSSHSITPNDVMTCTVNVSDSMGSSDTLSGSQTVDNRAPDTPTVVVDNQLPEATDTLTCSATSSDADGDSLTYTYNWYINYNQVSSSNTLTLTPTTASPGAIILCIATARDGHPFGNTNSYDSVEVQNTSPTVSTPSVSPTSGVTISSTLTCSATATDLNDGALAVSYTWSASNGSTSTGSTWALNSSIVSPNDTITCSAVTTDSDGASVSATSNAVTVDNQNPTVYNVSISASGQPSVGSTLTCSASAVDPEDGTLPPTYSWRLNGSLVGTGATYTIGNGASSGDTILCVATAVDGQGGTGTGTDSVTVTNTNPQVTNVQITPNPGYNDETFTCSATASDADGDTVTLSYSWTNSSGTVLSTSDIFDVSTVSMYPGQSFSCTVVGTDPSGGQDSSSVSTILANRAPNTPYVFLTWNSLSTYPTQGDPLYCNVNSTTVYDPDGTPVSTSYSWLSTASIGNQTSSTLNGIYVMSGELYSCTVTLSDGSLTSQGTSNLVQATDRNGQIQSNGVIEIDAETSQCGSTECDWSLELPDATRIDFVEVSGGLDPWNQYDLSHDLLVATTEMNQASVEAVAGQAVADFGSTQSSSGTFGLGNDFPMYNVSWHQAAWIANLTTAWHNQSTGQTLQSCFVCTGTGLNSTCSPVANYTQCSGYRLPTEAEWEYSARSGSILDFWTNDGSALASANTCSGVETLVDGVSNPLASLYMNYCGMNVAGTLEVASLEPNGFGLFDMHGNVAEWTADDSSCVFPTSTVDPHCVGSAGASTKVVRGGSWMDALNEQTASSSVFMHATTSNSSIGLRLIRNR